MLEEILEHFMPGPTPPTATPEPIPHGSDAPPPAAPLPPAEPTPRASKR